MSVRDRLTLQSAIAALCLAVGLVYPIVLGIASVRTFNQVSDTGRATDATIYNPPAYAIVATLVLLPIGAIVGFVTVAEMTAIRRRNGQRS